MTKISAVISTYNRARYLPKVLQHLLQQSLDKKDYEIIVVNNNSTDRTEAIAGNFHRNNPDIQFKYVIEINQGLSYGRNRGILESEGDYITFIDDDAFPDRDYLKVTAAYLDAHPEVVATGGKIHLSFEDEPPAWVNQYMASLLGHFDLGDKIKAFAPNNYPRGSNMSFRTSIFDQLGVFNTQLGRKGDNLEGSEEKDLFNRIYRTGKKVVYLPAALVHHTVPKERTSRAFIKRQSIGTGQSEYKRARAEDNVPGLIRSEIMKWGGTLLLSLYFMITLRPAVSVMLVRFRYWVNQGMRRAYKNNM